jgi:hypothetical protein
LLIDAQAMMRVRGLSALSRQGIQRLFYRDREKIPWKAL